MLNLFNRKRKLKEKELEERMFKSDWTLDDFNDEEWKIVKRRMRKNYFKSLPVRKRMRLRKIEYKWLFIYWKRHFVAKMKNILFD
jgi:hypothetical protein